MSWRERSHDLSPEHADVVGADGVHYVSPAMLEASRRLFLEGVDTADIDTSSPRFRQLQSVEHALSAEQRTRLSAQLEDQAKRQSMAAAHRAAASVAAAVDDCKILKAEFIRYKTQNNKFPSVDEAWIQINTGPSLPPSPPNSTLTLSCSRAFCCADNAQRQVQTSKASIALLHPILTYRLGYRSWARACDSMPLAANVHAAQIVAQPPTPAISGRGAQQRRAGRCAFVLTVAEARSHSLCVRRLLHGFGGRVDFGVDQSRSAEPDLFGAVGPGTVRPAPCSLRSALCALRSAHLCFDDGAVQQPLPLPRLTRDVDVWGV